MRAFIAAPLLALGLLCGCSNDSRVAYPTTGPGLALSRVVLYRNGVGYFERRGEVEGNILHIKVRKDQINDLLKSLTIVDRKTGRAVSVSMPLDPQTWAGLAQSTMGPGQGSLAQMLDSLRGMEVELDTQEGTLEGRVVMVEVIEEATSDEQPRPTRGKTITVEPPERDHKITLMQGQELLVVRLSKVKGVTIADGDLAMQFHRRLDAAAGEGMFQQVDVAIRLHGDGDHDLVVSYVVESPMWKPTYRVVLPENGKGDALLQAWAVVDNTSGEDWRDVKLALTAGAPIAFVYDLHTPRIVAREDLSESGLARQARAAVGETTFDERALADEEAKKEADADAESEPAAEETEAGDDMGAAVGRGAMGGAPPPGAPVAAEAPMAKSSTRARPRRMAAVTADKRDRTSMQAGFLRTEPDAPEPSAVSLESLRRSTLARTRASQASGQTRYDINTPVTVPDGSSTMVALVNQAVKGEETFMFRPGGAGMGYENNPYRVVRFRNTTPFVLEPGPISIYSGGSFVGEGISEVVGSNTSATVPFAVEPGIMVQRESKQTPEQLELVKIVRGTIHVERFHQVTTIWTAQAQTMKKGYTVLVRHPKQGDDYRLRDRPTGTEDLPGAYLVPINVRPGTLKGTVELVEQTPSRTTISIWDSKALEMFERVLIATNLNAEEKKKLEPLVALRREIGAIDTQMQGLTREQEQNNRRVELHQNTLRRLEKDKSPEAGKMRSESTKALEEFSKEGDRLARELIKLERERTRKALQLETLLGDLTIEPKK
jgi:hypothetical protein